MLSDESASLLLLSLCDRCLSLLHSTPPRPLFTQLGALELIDALLDIPSASSEPVLIRVAHALRLLLQQAGTVTQEPSILQAAAAALGHLARLGSPLTLDLVNFQVLQAFEWLQQSASAAASSSSSSSSPASELRELAAVLMLKQLAANAPTMFNPHVPLFLELIWLPVHALRADVREAAVLALRVCLVDVASRAERWKRSCYLKIFAHAQAGLQPTENSSRHGGGGSGRIADERKMTDREQISSPSRQRNGVPSRADMTVQSTARIHGSLLVMGELLEHASSDFMAPRFRTVTDLIMQHRQHTKTIQRTVMCLLPRAAKLSVDEFRRDYLHDVVAFISQHMESEQRDIAFLSLGRLAASMTTALLPFLPPLMAQLSTSLSLTIGILPVTTAPTSSTKASSFFGFSFGFGTTKTDEENPEANAEPNADRNRRYRRFTATAMACVGMLAGALGEQLKSLVQPQIDVMMQTGLSQALVDTLSSIVRNTFTCTRARAHGRTSDKDEIGNNAQQFVFVSCFFCCSGSPSSFSASDDSRSLAGDDFVSAPTSMDALASAARSYSYLYANSTNHRCNFVIFFLFFRLQICGSCSCSSTSAVPVSISQALLASSAFRWSSGHGVARSSFTPLGHSHRSRGS